MKRSLYIFKDNSCEVIVAVSGDVYLRLGGKGSEKKIGFLFFEREELVRTKRQYHIFQKMKAIGFPYVLLRGLLSASERGEIDISLEGIGTYTLTREGFSSLIVKWFKSQGFERQVFIPLENFGRL